MLPTSAHMLDPAMSVVPYKNFYRELGQRLAERRRAHRITQVQLAEKLGVAQQTLDHYEGGSLLGAVALLPPLAHTLGTSLEGLVGEDSKIAQAGGKRGPVPKIQQQPERVSELSKARQRRVAEVLDSILAQAVR